MANKTKFALTYDDVNRLMPGCSVSNLARILGGKRKWSAPIDARGMLERGASLEDVFLIAAKVAETDKDIHSRLILFAADCAARTLFYYKTTSRTPIIRDAIGVARRFARGEVDAVACNRMSEEMFKLSQNVSIPIYKIEDWRAAMACLAIDDPLEVIGAARSAEFAASTLGKRQNDAEMKWQKERIGAYLSDTPPDDWPLPPISEGQ